ncbi:MAG: FGGY-family carbohydrate kinase [Pseudomonadota bacterium]
MAYVLGIDNGLTVSKAVVFDAAGRPVATARRRVAQSMPAAHFVERDMETLWRETAGAIREALELACIAPGEIAAVAATAHGDGLYLVDAQARPLRPGILSLDSRAGPIVDRWTADGTAARALARTGQMPHASAPSAILAWIKAHEPQVFARIGTILAAKDWIRYCLTGTLGTDLTEASTSFTDVTIQAYADDIPGIFGLDALGSALPEVAPPDACVGQVHEAAAAMTGLTAGTPVVAGVHDVTASALGVGGYAPGTVAIVAGTYSINETISERPKTDPGWFCRNGIALGEWNNMAISPASAANYDWFLDTLMAAERQADGDALHDQIAKDVASVGQSNVLFHPYLFGAPHGPVASASFIGLRGWQGRAEMLRALIEGIAFNHRVHVDALRGAFDIKEARLTGGISRNPVFNQVFADALGLPVGVTGTEEAAAWGAALCAGSGVGLFETPRHDPRELEVTPYAPDPARAGDMDALYALHCETSDALRPVWAKLARRGSGE